MKKYLVISVSLIVMGPWAAFSEETTDAQKRFSGSLNVGLSQSFLDVEAENECAGCTTGAVDYETEGVNLYRILGNFNVWGASVFEFEYEQPFKKSDSQNQLLSATADDETSYEKFMGGIILDPLAARFFGENTRSHKIIKRLLSLKYSVTREAFSGKAKPNSNVVFVPMGTTIDYVNGTIVDGTNFTSGSELSFKTIYSDKELTMGLFTLDLSRVHVSKSVVRAGYYWATWERLADTQLSQISGLPIVYEADFESEGISISVVTVDKTAPGINVDIGAKFGTNDQLNSAIDWNQVSNQDADVQTLMMRYSAWYNYYFNKETKKGLGLSFGGTIDLRSTRVKNGSSFTNSEIPVAEARDHIFKYFLSASYRF